MMCSWLEITMALGYVDVEGVQQGSGARVQSFEGQRTKLEEGWVVAPCERLRVDLLEWLSSCTYVQPFIMSSITVGIVSVLSAWASARVRRVA